MEVPSLSDEMLAQLDQNATLEGGGEGVRGREGRGNRGDADNRCGRKHKETAQAGLSSTSTYNMETSKMQLRFKSTTALAEIGPPSMLEFERTNFPKTLVQPWPTR